MIVNKKVLEINEKFKYKININYPITKFNNVNKDIKVMLDSIIKNFIDSSKRNIMLNLYYTLYITYEEYKYKDIISYIFKVSEFTGGAHPNNYLKSIRFDYDGNIITIDTLISDDKNILIKLSNESRKILLSKDEFKSDNIINMVLDGTRPNKDNFENFALTNNGILVFFDYYQVGPYYYGVQKVLISYDKLL